jgi:hypothetical protein
MIAFLIVCLLPAALLFAAMPAVLLGLMQESLSRVTPESVRVASAPSKQTPVGWEASPSSSRLVLQTAA